MNETTNPIGTDPIGAEADADNPDPRGGTATIGASIEVNGEITGKEDLIINGHVVGTISLRENSVSIGKNGRVSADVLAKNIVVEGEVKGELRGSEQVTVEPSGRVTGDIRAPRVILNDGCQFKGSVDMEEKSNAPDSHGVGAKLSGNKPYPKRPTPPGSAQPKA